MFRLVLITCLVHLVVPAPQFVTFKDGQVGVNFLGYHAEAGLGGGQNGQGLLGGLRASAGTPNGQNAAAGLNGLTNGRSAGTLYAGAQATPNVGASAILGGDTSQGGYGGSEAHANGKTVGRTHSIVAGNTRQQNVATAAAAADVEAGSAVSGNAIQKIKPPKKYHSVEKTQSYPTRRRLIAPPPVEAEQPCSYGQTKCGKNLNREVHPDVVQQALQIPIGILQSLQNSFAGFAPPPKGH